jgi:SEC-C motif domain protein
MRSRYSAFAKNLAAYLLETWHATTQPPVLDLDNTIIWTGLEILSTSQGMETDTLGSVTFRAHYMKDGMPGAITEASDFIRKSERWFYLKGDHI